MATVTTEVEVEVTNNTANSDTSTSEPQQNKVSKFSQLRRRITNGNSDGTKRPSGNIATKYLSS